MSRVPYQILELSIISAQDLEPVAKNLKTYAVISIADRKVKTSLDQKGLTNPTWNDKFVFRIDDKILNSDTSCVAIEIFNVGWLRDSVVGSVTVLISSLLPPSARHERRFLALQIRRPSGRPQGILNLGVSLMDNTMKSMPLCTELNGSTVGFPDLWKGDEDLSQLTKIIDPDSKNVRLLRSTSDKTDITRKHGKKLGQKKPGSMCNVYGHGSVATGEGLGSVIDTVFATAPPPVVKNGSVVNGSMCNSDLGPSASVVAAAVAMGVYPIHQGPPPGPGSSVLEDWAVEEPAEDGVMTRIERWKMDLPKGCDNKYERVDKEKKRNRRRNRDWEEEDEGPVKCFGAVLGCEFAIVWGGGNKKKGGKKSRRRSKTSADSEF